MATPELLALLPPREGINYPRFRAFFMPKFETNNYGYPAFEGTVALPDTMTAFEIPDIGLNEPLPVVTFTGVIFRGTSTPCGASSYTYNFDRSVWFTWQLNVAREYAGPNGCGVAYRSGQLRLLDFWDRRVIIVILYLIYRGRLSQEEIRAFQLYTGFGLPKGIGPRVNESAIMNFAAVNGLLDQQMREGVYYWTPRVDVPGRYDAVRGISWGSRQFDFDHSSTRILDQQIGALLARFFGGEFADGVAIRFSTPSSMHSRFGIAHRIHPELFLFPGRARALLQPIACRDSTMQHGERCPMAAGTRKTRKSKKKSRKVKNKRKK